MSWQTRLTKCTYKGVILNLNSKIEIQSGKKGSVFDFPGIDGGSAQDLGNQQRKISVSCFVSGDDYDVERNTLESTLRSEGAGDLVHPTMGIFKVLPTSWRISESPEKKGGLCNFSINFAEILTPLTPQIISSSANYLSNSISNIISIQANRLDTVPTEDTLHPVALAREAVQTVENSIGSLAKTLSSIYTETSAVLDATMQDLILNDLETLVYSIQALTRLPSEAADRVQTVLTAYKNLFNNIKNTLNIFSDDQTYLYQCTLHESIENVCLTQIATTAATSTYVTRDDVITTIEDFKKLAYGVFQTQIEREIDEQNSKRNQPYKVSPEIMIDMINLVKLTTLTLYDIAAKLNPVQKEIIQKETTIIRFCYERNLDLEKFLTLNPTLIELGLLESGLEVCYA